MAAPAIAAPPRAAQPPARPPRAWPTRAGARAWIEGLHDELTALFTALDGGGAFDEVAWTRPGGGGGTARLLTDGATFEKAGINRSCVEGALPPAAAARLGGRADDAVAFFATGLSMVVHPRSPLVPTFHLNVRCFELADADGRPVDAWLGGGLDLTPTWPLPEDARDFHRALRDLCDAHHPALYPRYKAWCDDYFVNVHRDREARGVGGVFFDHLRPGEEADALARDGAFAFVQAVGRAPARVYAPIVERRRAEPHGDRERRCQLARRGRYVEFNLLHDRGTLFGLQTDARVESVLMSLPPLAAWPAPADDADPDAPEQRLRAMLAPRDWASLPD